MDDFRREVMECQRCDLCKTRKNVVFGMGDPHADVLLIGEGPGAQEDEQGLPFVGRSGKLLDQFLDCFDLARGKNVYIANIVKCRPPENRDPTPYEQEQCIGWLYRQIELIDPKVIVCLGRIAAQVMIRDNFRVSAEHGVFYEKDGRLIMGTFHPAAILRNPNHKPLAFDDFAKLRDKLEELSRKETER